MRLVHEQISARPRKKSNRRSPPGCRLDSRRKREKTKTAPAAIFRYAECIILVASLCFLEGFIKWVFDGRALECRWLYGIWRIFGLDGG